MVFVVKADSLIKIQNYQTHPILGEVKLSTQLDNICEHVELLTISFLRDKQNW